MDLDRLSEFAAVARGGNIKAVAQELGLPPATLSARLRGFEKELGMELFRRVAGGLALTEAGERLLPSAEEILASLVSCAESYKRRNGIVTAACASALPAPDCRSTSGRSWTS